MSIGKKAKEILKSLEEEEEGWDIEYDIEALTAAYEDVQDEIDKIAKEQKIMNSKIKKILNLLAKDNVQCKKTSKSS